jgi:hypothetical protein
MAISLIKPAIGSVNWGTDVNNNWTTLENAINAIQAVAVRAWVSFGPTGTINASYNVTSVVRNTFGDYTINFTTAMPSANYAVVGSAKRDSGNADGTGNLVITVARRPSNPSTTSVRIRTQPIDAVANGFDPEITSIVCIGG